MINTQFGRFAIYCILHFSTGVLLSLASNAQTLPDPDKTFGEGTTIRKTTATNNDTFIPETKTEYFDKNGKLRKEVVETKDLEGNKILREKEYDEEGRIKEKHERRNDADGNLILTEVIRYDKDGKVRFAYKQARNEKGDWIDFPFDKEKQEFNDKAGKVLPKSPESCDPGVLIFGAYSFLSGDAGNDKENFSGGHFSAVYNFNSHFGAGLNISMHSKKTGDEKLSRSLFLVEGNYFFRDKEDCDKNFLADIHVLLGIGSESFKYKTGNNTFTSKGSGPAFGAGVSGIIQLTNKIGLKAEADYIGIKFKDADKINNNFRGSAGILWQPF